MRTEVRPCGDARRHRHRCRDRRVPAGRWAFALVAAGLSVVGLGCGAGEPTEGADEARGAATGLGTESVAAGTPVAGAPPPADPAGSGQLESDVAPPPGLPDGPWLVEVAAATGLTFTHDAGMSPEKHMPETLSGGAALADFNGDGWLDVYLVQSGPIEASQAAGAAGGAADGEGESAGEGDGQAGSEGDGDGIAPHRPHNALFFGVGDGTFTDVTAASGAAGGPFGYGMGVCVGDVDNDGDVDMHLTSFGADVLLQNDGAGVFTDVTDRAGIDNAAWSSSCAFADYDRDGCLDLYVANYVDYAVGTDVVCGSPGQPAYCHPDAFSGVPDILYRNRCDGSGSFENVTERAGVRNAEPNQSKGLGVLWLDFDDDGWPDLYVANDSTRNFLYRNEGDGTFTEAGLVYGGAFNAEGKTEAGMGVDAGDTDGDGREDVFVTNLDFETNTLYRSSDGGFLNDVTEAAGLGGPSLPNVGFGTHLFDFDHDRDVDVFVANGHIIDNIQLINPSSSFAQRAQLMVNAGDGSYVEASAWAGPYFQSAYVGRGTALGDVDEDGDLDLLVINLDGPAVLLENAIGQDTPSLRLRLLTATGRDAIGAKVSVLAGGRATVATVRSARSYLSASDPRLVFGLGADAEAIERIDIRWPDGREQSIPAAELELGRVNVITQAAADEG